MNVGNHVGLLCWEKLVIVRHLLVPDDSEQGLRSVRFPPTRALASGTELWSEQSGFSQ